MANQYFGAYRAIVVGAAAGTRVQIKLPWLAGDHTMLAAVCRPFGARTAAPQIDDEVLVVFEFGDVGRPIVIGSLW